FATVSARFAAPALLGWIHVSLRNIQDPFGFFGGWCFSHSAGSGLVKTMLFARFVPGHRARATWRASVTAAMISLFSAWLAATACSHCEISFSSVALIG